MKIIVIIENREELEPKKLFYFLMLKWILQFRLISFLKQISKKELNAILRERDPEVMGQDVVLLPCPAVSQAQ